MSILQKQKGPAKAATFPDHGSKTRPAADMDMNDQYNTTFETEMATETRDIGDAYDLLVQFSGLMRVMWLATDGGGLFVDDRDRDGLQWFVMHLDERLDEVKAILKAELKRGGMTV